MVASLDGCGSVSIHMSRSKRVAGIVPSQWIWPLPSLTEHPANCFLFRLIARKTLSPMHRAIGAKSAAGRRVPFREVRKAVFTR
jgi:hypothetical protein